MSKNRPPSVDMLPKMLGEMPVAMPPALAARLAALYAAPDGQPLAAHLVGGWRTGSRPAPWFDPAGYEVLSARRDDPSEAAIVHFAREGEAAGLDPDPLGICTPEGLGPVSLIVLLTAAGDAARLAALLDRPGGKVEGEVADEAEWIAVDLSTGHAAARILAAVRTADLASGRLRLLALSDAGDARALAAAEASHARRLIWPLPHRLPPALAAPPRLAGRRSYLREGGLAPRLILRCPAPNAARARHWGDFHFAESLARALTDEGAEPRIVLSEDWEGPESDDADATLLLRGVRRRRPRPGPVNLMWMLSHPDRVEPAELARYDHVFVASERHAARLASELGGDSNARISPLLQCSDPFRFAPESFPRETWEQVPAHPLLFVGNSRRTERWVVSAALAAGAAPAIYGAEWDDTPAAPHVLADHLPNDLLGAYYGRAGIVLNDHWPDMAENGFLSNRLFDVAMAGGFVLSDRVAGAGRFFGQLVQVGDGAELARAITYFTTRPAERQARARALQALVRREHTFAHRARTILARLQSMF